jgi:hypothetical protein|tara:strand:+ start:1774 stop:1965 length:192 start_codon:yes stop_codon:yes gene_type:complete
MKTEYWNKERKQHYLKLVAKEVKRATYMKSYMARKRAEGKIKHWRQYKIEKEANGITKIQQNK